MLILDKQNLLKYINEKKMQIEPLSNELLQNVGMDLRISNKIVRLRKKQQELDTYQATNLGQYYNTETSYSFTIGICEHVLVSSVEKITLPTDIVGIISLRSTYARLGLSLSAGIINPGFMGQLTLEMHGGSFPIRLHADETLFHVFFVKLDANVEPYNGKYQDQRGPAMPKLSALTFSR